MRTVTQNDFQNLYRSPGYDQTEDMRRFLANLPDRKTPEIRPVIRKRRVAFVLAAVLALMGIAAVAVDLYSRALVTWDGEIKENDRPDETMLPQGLMDRMYDAVKTVPDDLLASAVSEEQYHTLGKDITRRVSTQEELVQILDEAGYPHREKLIPDGWTFRSAELSYSCTPEGHYELVSETPYEDFVLYQYSLDEQYRILTGYAINLEKGSETAVVSSGLTFMTNMSIAYPSADGLEAGKLTVPGMEEAFFARYGNRTDITMYRTLDKTVHVYDGAPSDNGDTYEGTGELNYEMLMFSDLEPEEVLPLFTEAE